MESIIISILPCGVSCERMQNDRNILTGPEGVQIVSETGRTQLEMVKFENKRKKELIISLLKKHECLLKVCYKIKFFNIESF